MGRLRLTPSLNHRRRERRGRENDNQRKRKARAANGAELDPVFAAIAEHKRLRKEFARRENIYRTARSQAVDLWNRAGRADRKAGMRLAKTKPTTVAGAAALVAYTQRDIVENFSELSNWCTIALKTAASALARMEAT